MHRNNRKLKLHRNAYRSGIIGVDNQFNPKSILYKKEFTKLKYFTKRKKKMHSMIRF